MLKAYIGYWKLLLWVTGLRLVDRLIDWAKREYSCRHRVTAVISGVLVFGVLLPLVIVFVSFELDKLLGLEFCLRPYSTVLGLVLMAAGLFFLVWAAYALWSIGKGTPLPYAPTKRLVVKGPYAYCRNPIVFGALLYYMGLVLVVGAVSGPIVVVLFTALALLYVKFVEEKELEARFGAEYIEYKEKTPFLIPRPRRDKG